MYLIELNYLKPLEVIDQIRDEHVAFLKKYYEKGIFVMSGAKVPREGGVIIAGNTTKEQLEELVKEDPFWQQQVAEYRIIEFQATLHTEDFDSFF